MENKEAGIARPDPGPRPELRWIDKLLLTVDASYQRSVSSSRGQALIAKLAANWFWAHASVIIVAQKGELWTIIDGQHRHQAALRIPDIKDLPCLIVDADNMADQAKAFIAHNRDRVTLNYISLFHAGVAAGDPISKAVIDVCTDCGVEIIPRPMTIDFLKPNQTMAVGALQRIFVNGGGDHLRRVINVIRNAFPATRGQLRSHVLTGVSDVINAGGDDVKLTAALKQTTGIKLEDDARALRSSEGCSIPQGFAILLGRLVGISITGKMQKKKKTTPKPAPKPEPKQNIIVSRQLPKADVKVAVDPVRPLLGNDNIIELCFRTLNKHGKILENNNDRHARTHPYKIGTRLFTMSDLTAHVDKLRALDRLPPLSKLTFPKK